MLNVEAVILPLAINGEVSASADSGISNKLAPLPLKDELTLSCTFPLTNKEPLNSVVTEPVPCTLKNPASSKDAVTEPVDICGASSESADCGILNNSEPSPTNPLDDILALADTLPNI